MSSLLDGDERLARGGAGGLPPDPLAARVLAHALIEQTQVRPRPDHAGRLAEQARLAGWGEVRVLLLHCQLIGRSLQGAGHPALRETSDAMLGAAQAVGDEILIALAMASRALFVVGTEHPDGLGDDVSDLLTQAAAMLHDATESAGGSLGLRALELPASYVECGQAFHRLGLWELEEEMYGRAAAALELPLPEQVRVVPSYTRRALVVNRLESAVALASAMLEVGLREPARRVAAAAVRPSPAEREDLPAVWCLEVLALERFLDLVAGREDVDGGPTSVPDRLYEQLGASTWSGYQACLLLAAAVGASDQGDVASAASLAAQARLLLDDAKPSLTTLALALAAANTHDGPALRYARHLAGLRWQQRLAVLGAVRSRLAAARVLRQGEQLNRHANVDALTGLANRHAETRHLDRLRRLGSPYRVEVILLDVDHFKAVNDTFGHTVGDQVLQAIGRILQAAIRACDVAVRRGGDEFLLILDLLPHTEPPASADDILHAVRSQRWHDVAAGLRVTISAGRADGPAGDVDHLIHEADEHLYRAKAGGRGQVRGSARS